MGSDWKMGLYRLLPVRLQEAALAFYARGLERLYYGPGYESWKDRAREWRRGTPDSRQDWIRERLSYIVRTAALKAPFYRKKWKGIGWKEIGRSGPLSILPTICKQEIRMNEAAFLNEDRSPKSLWMEKTSGTTGTSLKIFWPKEMLPKWWALVEVLVRNEAGVGQDVPRAMVGGRPIIRGDAGKPPYWRYNRRWRQLYFSSYHISRETAPHYIGSLKKYRSRWMTGYGSAIAALAESSSGAGLAPCPLETVIVSGDTLLAGMRRSIEAFFRCKCRDSYGQAEGVLMAMECGMGRMHLLSMTGIAEILREDGSPCGSGEVGEIVATGLLNDAMPLVRYRTGDYASWAVQQTCSCGNPEPVIENLEGRVDDYIITEDGRKIGRLSTAMKRSPRIHSSQLVQDRPGHAYLLVRPSDGYRHSHALDVREDILQRIGRFDLEIREVPEIPKTPSGKLALVVRLDERPGMKPVYEKFFKGTWKP